MRIALTGASGFLGSNIARHLHEQGHDVTALVRESSRRDHIEPYVDRFVVGDHADKDAWPALLDGAGAIVHNSLNVRCYRASDWHTHLTSNLVGSIELLLASAPVPFVFISTVAVHHGARARWAGTIDEDHPTLPYNLYGAYKAAVETHLWAAHHEHGRHAVAVRPSAVYGHDPTGKNLHTGPVLETVRNGEAYTKSGANPFVHVDDVSRFTRAAIERPEASGHAFNLVDLMASYPRLAELAGEAIGKEPRLDLREAEEVTHTFDCSAAQSLVDDADFLNRGYDGIRRHFAQLAAETSG